MEVRTQIPKRQFATPEKTIRVVRITWWTAAASSTCQEKLAANSFGLRAAGVRRASCPSLFCRLFEGRLERPALVFQNAMAMNWSTSRGD